MASAGFAVLTIIRSLRRIIGSNLQRRQDFATRHSLLNSTAGRSGAVGQSCGRIARKLQVFKAEPFKIYKPQHVYQFRQAGEPTRILYDSSTAYLLHKMWQLVQCSAGFSSADPPSVKRGRELRR